MDDDDLILNEYSSNNQRNLFKRYNQTAQYNLSDDDSDDYSDTEWELSNYEALIKESQDIKISKAFSLIKSKNL